VKAACALVPEKVAAEHVDSEKMAGLLRSDHSSVQGVAFMLLLRFVRGSGENLAARLGLSDNDDINLGTSHPVMSLLRLSRLWVCVKNNIFFSEVYVF
jgi:hypothetical protein